MKKFSKFGKRVLALFIISLLNINTFATQTSNDGSAFITKAEFDTLMEDFNRNMNTYQSDLNAKIDDAIANYIAGLSGVSVSTSDWPLSTMTKAGKTIKVGDLGRFTHTALSRNYDYTIYHGWAWTNSHSIQNATRGSGLWQENFSSGAKNGTCIETDDNLRLEKYYTTYYLSQFVNVFAEQTEGGQPYSRHITAPTRNSIGTYVITDSNYVKYCAQDSGTEMGMSRISGVEALTVTKTGSTDLTDWTFVVNTGNGSDNINTIKSSETGLNRSSETKSRGSIAIKYSVKTNGGTSIVSWDVAGNDAAWAGSGSARALDGATIPRKPHAIYNYSLKATTKARNTLITKSISEAWGSDVKVGTGIPVIKTEKAGKVSFSFNYLSSKECDFAIRPQAFTCGSAISTSDLVDVKWTADGASVTNKVYHASGITAAKTIRVEFDAEENKTYYLGIGKSTDAAATDIITLSNGSIVDFIS